MKIFLSNETEYKLPVAWVSALLSAGKETLRSENIKRQAADLPGGLEVSLTFVDNDAIWELNKEYRGVDRPTDVLSFPQYQENEPILPASSLGDIVISLPKMAEQAKSFGHSQKREVCFLFVHGLLHLLGYYHEISEEEERLQFGRQEAILNEVGLSRTKTEAK
jgi:probable rRNA maturation factor